MEEKEEKKGGNPWCTCTSSGSYTFNHYRAIRGVENQTP